MCHVRLDFGEELALQIIFHYKFRESDMTNDIERNCPECQSKMRNISIIDRSRLNEFRSIDSVLTYATPDAKPGFWTGSIPAEGVVAAYACTQCGRIALYAKKA